MHSPLNKICILLFSACSLTFISCKKFLSAYSQNSSFVESAADLDEVLVGDGYFTIHTTPITPALYTMDDDLKDGVPGGNYKLTTYRGFHNWQSEPRRNSDGVLLSTDDLFNKLYSKLARLNSVLSSIPALREKGEPEGQLKRIAGEAHFLRAYYYFILTNLFGKPYRATTAADDFSVPLKTEAAITSQFAVRSSNQRVFNQIVADLQEAVKNLAGVEQKSALRANQSVAQALLSRVYLFMENYEQANYYADQVIANKKYSVTDLNSWQAGKNVFTSYSSEVIFNMGGNSLYNEMALGAEVPDQPYYLPSDELVLLYSAEDLRTNAFFVKSGSGQWKIAKMRDPFGPDHDMASDFYLIRLSEVYLNKAEALAAMDRFGEARTTLQAFRKYRFKPNELPSLTDEGAALMSFIRDERRRELCLEAHRWFDLRRYAVNSKYPFNKKIRHRNIEYTGTGYQENGYYELGTYQDDPGAYIVPIANDEIDFNQGAITNEPRPVRPVKY
ncbi:RagB/SusD family nutrient uptake outer membrane protein [Pseudobacter ginsenosidimutans]|uniref:Putative outer membrane starch-binding protein n=1 Tax=Pseudobacter ginsenosidimutans TaxID=661488 RepID=A0A4Q7MRF9_9BACT|nr:RagB/SusD family nutrient uptake outer membrane protein [Pseudobacter ginsenosidimutans]RZS71008.1 putative outer membrane starch-binding protein [Pseudobacter ginsenosidimutans]